MKALQRWQGIVWVQIASCRGVTVIELLVVLSILSILAGLLLPAIQDMRERSRISQCQNRLRQLGVAVHQHHNAFGHLPTGGWGYKWVGQSDRPPGSGQPGGWVFNLLPYIGERSLHQQMIPSADGRIPAGTLGVELPAVRCPSRPGEGMSQHAEKPMPYNTQSLHLVARSDFAACEGDRVTNSREGPVSLRAEHMKRYRWADSSKATGVCFQRSAIRFRDVRDGLTQTYYAGEKYVGWHGYDGTDDLGHDQSALSGVDIDLIRWTHRPPRRDSDVNGYRRFGSAHSAGFSMMHCDGSVRLIDFRIDAQVHRQSGTRFSAGNR